MKYLWSAGILAVGVVALCYCAPEVSPAKTGGLPDDIDAAKPASWEPAVAQARQRLEKVTEDLIVIAKDGKRPAEHRRRAINLLGQIGCPSSSDFLVAHISLVIPVTVIKGDVDAMRETPCFHALYSGKDWNVAKAILQSLDKDKPEEDQWRLAYIFRRILGKKLAMAVVEQQLKVSKNIIRTKNLQAFKKYVPQK